MSIVPSEIGGYQVERELNPAATYLVVAPGGRRLVLKRLEEDCLLQGQLHPSVRDRLGRVRELAHGGIANLHGVEREGQATWLVWEYVQGVPWHELNSEPQSAAHGEATASAGPTMPAETTPGPDAPDPALRRLLLLARELVLTVQMLHARGIIHGAIHPRNIFLRDEKITLTHISPYLWADPQDDADAVIEVLTDLLPGGTEATTPFGRMLAEACSARFGLDTLLERLTALIDQREPEGGRSLRRGERRQRLLTVAGAVLLAVAAGMGAWGLWQYLGGVGPKPPAPPEAPPRMMRLGL